MTVEQITPQEIKSLGFVPEPHTVTLKDHGKWFALKDNGQIVSLLCIRPQRNELYIGEVFTPKEFRKKGYMTVLCDTIVNKIYPEYSVSTHALWASKHCFERCGFRQFSFREFKYGNQWWLRRDGKKYVSN